MPQLDYCEAPIYSTLGSDPDFGELVELFVEEMPERVALLLDQLAWGDWEHLSRSAHQLKGSAGGYGFALIGPAAAKVEEAVRDARPDEQVRKAVEELVDLCLRARAGAPD